MDAFLEVKGLKKSYKDKEVLHGIDFTIHKGSLFALLGPNGAGKSTTISILCGLLEKDAGSIYLHGECLDNIQLIRKKIGVVFQNHCMDEILSGFQNLYLRCGFYGLSNVEAKNRVKELASLCELQPFLNQRVATLSGGQKRRLDIARALIPSPSLLILDEPTTGLDPMSRSHIWKMMQNLQKEKEMSILLTTHYLEEAKDADTICILYDGKVAVYGDLQTIRQSYVQDYLYLYANCLDPIIRILNNRKLPFKQFSTHVKIPVSSPFQALSILQACSLSLARFEVIRGTLEDVYVSILEGDAT